MCQRLEDSVLSGEKHLTVQGPSPDAPPTCLPARVREIVTKNLSDSSESQPAAICLRSASLLCSSSDGRSLGSLSAAGAMSSVMSLQEENRVLQGELARLEDSLAHSRADRDELAIKYGAISERVRQDGKIRNRSRLLNTFCINIESLSKPSRSPKDIF